MKHNGILRLATLLKLSTLIIAARTECECGRSGKFYGTLKRIVNGVQTAPHEYPWMALLLYRGKAYCGGSVINNYYILTAAHCAVTENVRWMKVALGVHDRITMDKGRARIHAVERVFVHPKYADRKYYDENDVALLKLYKPIRFDNRVRPVCLPYKGEVFTRKAAVVTGWGAKDDGGYTDRFLQKITVMVLSNCECLKSKISDLFWKILMKDGGSLAICAYERNVDSCQGDSGGPLVTTVENDLMVQIGVVSFGKLCGDISSPGVYAQVTHYLDWIRNVTIDAKYCKKPAYKPITYEDNECSL